MEVGVGSFDDGEAEEVVAVEEEEEGWECGDAWEGPSRKDKAASAAEEANAMMEGAAIGKEEEVEEEEEVCEEMERVVRVVVVLS